MPDEDAAREGDPQLAGGANGGQPLLGVLGRRALVGGEVGVDRLEHQALRGGDLAQAREVVARQDAEVGVGQQPALEPLLAGPHDVGGEVLEAPLAEALAHARVMVGRLAGEDEQLLDAPARGVVEQRGHLVGRVQVRTVRGEGAVLAEALARARERERDVAREGDAAPHPRRPYRRGCAGSRRRLPCSRADGPLPRPRRARPRRRARRRRAARATSEDRPNQSAQARPGLPAQRGARRDLPGPGARLHGAEGVDLSVAAPSSSTDSVKLLLGGRAQFAILDIHDLALAREKGRDIVGVMAARAAPAGRRHRPAADRAAARPRGQARRGHRPALRRRRPELDRARRRRRPGQGAQGDHRLPGRHGAALAPRRRGDGVLERRGRGAAGQAPGHAPVQGRRLRRPALPRARAVREPPDPARRPRAGGGHRARPAPRLRGDDQRPGVGGRGARRARARRPRRHARASSTPSRRPSPRASRATASSIPRRWPPGRAGRPASASPSARPTSRAPSPPASSSGAARGRRRPCRRRAGAARAPRRGRRAAASRPRCARRAPRGPAPSARW